MKDKIIYILGAGCSMSYGYPLAKNFRAALKVYGESLTPKPNCERLRRCITNTVSLMEEHQAPTVDRLVLQIEEELDGRKRPLAMWDAAKHSQLEKSANDQILDAKTVTVALFLDLEINARATRLHGIEIS